MSEVSLIELVDLIGKKTSNTNFCNNNGCGFNVNGKCTASGTECFGYIKPKHTTPHKVRGEHVNSKRIS